MKQVNEVDYKELFEQSQQEKTQLMEEFVKLRQTNQELLHRIDMLLKLTFGSKGERYLGKEAIAGQMRLELDEEVQTEIVLEGTEKVVKTKGATSKKKRPSTS